MKDNTPETIRTLCKKPYQAPKMKRLGSIADITRGPTGGNIDGIAGGVGGFQPLS